ncbi:NifU family protein [Magnetospira sp. QH-2]|uniref:NifU family protein n=1 Tax=Magnetospira sp. (strain QH-2) TaxID=1288970 RepID=UPI0003E81617|nr:NifU family protein [Magnetospira sp. QH-2]CCQ75696.1 putative NifU domain protein [Magnetospira sp. QH-2]
MFIQTEATPNPATLKFLPGRSVLGSGSANFPKAEDAVGKSPLAERLFQLDGVAGVFLGGDFITVTKGAEGDWETLKPVVLGAIMDHFTADLPIMNEDVVQETAGDEDALVGKIKELLDTRVRPAVAADGGDIVFESFEDGIVYLHMQGSCAGCPSSTATLKHGIENMLKYYVPEVQEVRAVN